MLTPPRWNFGDMAITPDGHTAYLTDEYSILPLNLATNTFGAAISVPGGVGPFIALAPDGSTAYVIGNNTLQPIQLPSGKIGTPITLPVQGFDVTGLAITRNGRTAYVPALDWVLTVNLSRGRYKNEIPVPGGAYAVAIAP